MRATQLPATSVGTPGDDRRGPVDVLVVGAGPTGLTLAAQAHALGATVRIVERRAAPRRQSRAFAVHARTLEVLRPLGVAGALVDRGTSDADLRLHFGDRVVSGRLSDVGMADTAYPFVLVIPQAEVEAVLEQHLAAVGVRVERGTTFDVLEQQGDEVRALVRAPGGETEQIRARYLAGCDGADSTVRAQAGIRFPGGAYPRTLLLADLEADGDLTPGAVHVYIGASGMLFFFPLGHDATWRLLTARPRHRRQRAPPVTTDPSLEDLQRAVDRSAGGLRLHSPVRMTGIRLDHRQADRYRRGRVFLAGDAAHVHSPAGAQGMNTGIQDACNLGWKLALAARGLAGDALLDSYEQERRPVGRRVRRLTDLAFILEASDHPLIGLGRALVAPRIAPILLRNRRALRTAIRFASGLDIRYRSVPARRVDRRVWRRAARPGARLPNARVACDGTPGWLHDALSPPGFHLLLFGPDPVWDGVGPTDLARRHGEILTVQRVSPDGRPGSCHDVTGDAARRLGFSGAGHCLVRPDGYLAFRSGRTDLAGVSAALDRCLRGPGPATPDPLRRPTS